MPRSTEPNVLDEPSATAHSSPGGDEPVAPPEARGSARRVVAHAVAASVVDAAVVGVFTGLLDLLLILVRGSLEIGDFATTAAAVLGLVITLAVTAGTLAMLVLRAIGRHPWVAPLVAALREPGAPRVEALARIGLVGAALGGIWVVAGLVLHSALHTSAKASLLQPLGATEIAIGAFFVVMAVSAAGPLTRFAGRSALLRSMTRGRRGAALLIAALVAGAGVGHLVLRSAVPALDPYPIYLPIAGGVALVVAAIVGPCRRWRPRRVAVAAFGCALLACAAPATIGSAQRARHFVVAYGSVSRMSLSSLWRLSDADRDGYPARFGGADCDDGDRKIHPGAREIPGNRVDDNCSLGDAAPRAEVLATPKASVGAARRERPDVVLISIDALRADHVSVYGYGRATTPNVDALAARGARFLRAQSPCPATVRAIPALMLGRPPSALPFTTEARKATLGQHHLPSLASVMRDAGYATGVLMEPDVGSESLRTGFDYREVGSPTSQERWASPRITADALRWLDGLPAGKPAFLWIHYFEPHFPYEPARGAVYFGDDDSARYDSEINFVDAQIGRFVAGLEERGRLGRTIVAVTADHGEAFGDHGGQFHGWSLYEELTRVPLVFVVPGVEPVVVGDPVTLLDVAPTLLDLAGLSAPATMTGRSLASPIRTGAKLAEGLVLTELKQGGRHLVALHRGRHKVIRDLVSWTEEVYDLEADPSELHDLSGTAVAGGLIPLLDQAIEQQAVSR